MKEIPVTINKNVLEALPVWQRPTAYSLSSMGLCCWMDPPGYPSYYVQNVYNRHGNTPHVGATEVLFGRVLAKADKHGNTSRREQVESLIRSLWSPLPVDNSRVKDWARSVSWYFRAGVISGESFRTTRDVDFISIDNMKNMIDDGTLRLEKCAVAAYILKYYPSYPREELYELTVAGSKAYVKSSWER
jgi:hypothetical protein